MMIQYQRLAKFKQSVKNHERLDPSSWYQQLSQDYFDGFYETYQDVYLLAYFVMGFLAFSVLVASIVTIGLGLLPFNVWTLSASFALSAQMVLSPWLGYTYAQSWALSNHLDKIKEWNADDYFNEHSTELDCLVGLLRLTKMHLRGKNNDEKALSQWLHSAKQIVFSPAEIQKLEEAQSKPTGYRAIFPPAQIPMNGTPSVPEQDPYEHTNQTEAKKSFGGENPAEVLKQARFISENDEAFYHEHHKKVLEAYNALDSLLNRAKNQPEQNGESANYYKFVGAYAQLGSAWRRHQGPGLSRFPVNEDFFEKQRHTMQQYKVQEGHDYWKMLDNIEQKANSYNELQLNDRYMKIMAKIKKHELHVERERAAQERRFSEMKQEAAEHDKDDFWNRFRGNPRKVASALVYKK